MTESNAGCEPQKSIAAIVSRYPVVPLIVIDRLEDILPVGRALVAGGLNILEIAMRTPQALAAVAELRRAMPDVLVGVGTVLNKSQYVAAEQAGAQFVVTPGITQELLAYGLVAEVPLLPGIATVSELMEGYSLGYRWFKFFPAVLAGGVETLKAISQPFPDAHFFPSGGITPTNAKDFLALENVDAVGGSWLAPQEIIAAGDWAALEQLVAESLEAVKGC